MKKTRFLVLALAVAVMLMGAGYAWWDDYTNVSATVDTGDMNVHWLDYREAYTDPTSATIDVDPYMDCEIDAVSAKDLHFTITNIMPGGRGTVRPKIKNDSTFPVKFDNAVFTSWNVPAELQPFLNAKGWLRHYDASGALVSQVETSWDLLENFDDNLNASTWLQDQVFEPGDVLSFDSDSEGDCISIELDNDAPNDTQNKVANFTLQVNWKQWNKN